MTHVKKKSKFLDLRAFESFFNSLLTSAVFVFTHGVFNTWLTYSDVQKSKIGYMSLLALPFALNPLWVGFLDVLKVPFIKIDVSKRKVWLFLMIALSSISIFILSFLNPKNNLLSISIIILYINIFIATADAQIDSYRIEIAKDKEQTLFTSYAVMGYRVGMLVFSTMILILVDYLNNYECFSNGRNWSAVFRMFSIFLPVMTILNIIIFKKNSIYTSEANYKNTDNENSQMPRKSNGIIYKSIYLPVSDFIRTNDHWLLISIFILVSKAPDIIALNMLTPFLKEKGFSISEVVIVNKTVGFATTILGSFFGGVLCLRIGLKFTIFLGLILQSISNISFIIQNIVGHNLFALYITMSIESFCNGFATAGFLGLMSIISNRSKFKGFLYASLGSLAYFGFAILSSLSGKYAELVDWNTYFLTSIVFGILPLSIYYMILKLKIPLFTD